MPEPLKRIAIVGGGIAGLAAAYELEVQRRRGKPVDWQLYEASDRLGGTVQTTRLATPEGEFLLEGGPDGWVTDKPWARELAEELGLREEIVPCNEADKKTYVWLDGGLVAMPDRMRMMVPEDLAAIEDSPLFSPAAKQAYTAELDRAAELKTSMPFSDESVASFVRRHFGEEVLEKIAAPLLSGVFGGDTARLSVRAVMPELVKMEAEYGSLIAALQARRRERGAKPPVATFTTLRRGMGTLVDAIVARLPQERVHTNSPVFELQYEDGGWDLYHEHRAKLRVKARFLPKVSGSFAHLLLATPLDVTRKLLQAWDPMATTLLPAAASSAVLATFCWPRIVARTVCLPPGFGFLVPQGTDSGPRLLAGSFTDQKYPDRAPEGARVLRVFFGGRAAEELTGEPDEVIAKEAWQELQTVLPGLPAPEPSLTVVHRWPSSLPQYEVGHLERMEELDHRVAELGNLDLLGNAYRGVGVPDLIRDARMAARTVVMQL